MRAESGRRVLLPQYAPLIGKFLFLPELGELPIMFWLLIWGARTRPATPQAA